MDKRLELGIRVLDAMDDGDISELDNIFNTTERDVLEITPVEKCNWLHKALLGFDESSPPPKIINYLISQGVEINAQDIYGMTPLHYAMRAKNVDAAIALLEAGADPNIPNNENLIPLSMIGYIPERLDVLELMLIKGANVNHFVNENETILQSYKPTESEPYLLPIYELMKKYS